MNFASPTIYPHYGVFAPIRDEYVDLIATTPLPNPLPSMAFDILIHHKAQVRRIARSVMGGVLATSNNNSLIKERRWTR